jgi:hypothetical protein
MGEGASAWREGFVQPLLAAYAAVSDVAAVALSGSAARGAADRWSDVESMAFWSRPPGEFDPDPRLLNFAQGVLDAVPAHGSALLDGWKGRLGAYPDELQVAAVRRSAQIDHFWRWRMYPERPNPIDVRPRRATRACRGSRPAAGDLSTRASPSRAFRLAGLSTPSTGSTGACAHADNGGEWWGTGSGDTHPAQGTGTFGGRGVRALSRSSRPVSSADPGRPGQGRATPNSPHARAGRAPSVAPSPLR